ncbi:MAG: putative N-acetylmannosamine-6-phosphate 2-epimerase, partial [Mycoplasmoidaceae bacterium]|nr:putative N-acetylmannosamine-6-phosphate 2-epimerase [Mycoplasmoidaceae bacterium]
VIFIINKEYYILESYNDYMTNQEFFNHINKSLIVSCQAVDNEPLNNKTAITLMAKACIEGGAKTLRLSQVKHIKAIKKFIKKNNLNVPVIGIIKKRYPGSEVFITPTLGEVKQLLKLHVNVIALDATVRQRPNESLEEIVKFIRTNYPDQLIMADCADEQDVLYADKLGFDIIGTTLRGYTQTTKGLNNIDNNFAFIK